MGFRDFINSVKKEFVTPPKENTPPVTNCPNCGAPLEKDAIQGTSVCPYCGTQLNDGKTEFGVVDTVVAFIERQQTKLATEKERKRKEKEIEEEKKRERLKKTWWIPLLVLAVIGLAIFAIIKLSN